MLKTRATIIGGKGFIGRHLAARLLAAGWDCHVPKREEASAGKKDLGHLFYCAGLTADYLRRPFDTIEAHVSLLSRILEADHFESLVYLSSTRLYDSQPSIIGREEIPLVLTPANPRHLYDLSKALGESLCLTTGQGRCRVARLSCVYNNHTDKDGFLPGLLRRIIKDRPAVLEIDSSPTFARDYIHLDDVLDALILIATRGKEGIYNVASGENIRNETLFATLSKAGDCRIIPLRNDESPAPARISIKKMEEEFDWHPLSVLDRITALIEENRQC
ncbi:MAG: NAD(P)-dependent oxidoreductase [Proteobacteria bacterium]|nr:NAD(P)-dependent oxidoreductase [Pseudomonadota bacterium]MBU1649809.1 NAD(P)-dependent oxidoreductase [Pseudomonadota bacterium]